jgi:prepilin-type N-terminal cleavage/methylation domain-containing protein
MNQCHMKKLLHPVRSGGRGFTLLELLAAITIVSVLVGISIAAFSNVGGSSRIRGAVAELRSTLRFARMHAMANNEAVHVLFYGHREGDVMGNTIMILYPNSRENFKFLKSYVCFAATQNKFVSDWKTLPDGLVFDPGADEGGMSQNLFEEKLVPIGDYPPDYEPVDGDPSKIPWFHKLTFLPDGTIEPIAGSKKSLTIYLAEGATNAEEELNGINLKVKIAKDPTHFGLTVFPLTGAVQVTETQVTP